MLTRTVALFLPAGVLLAFSPADAQSRLIGSAVLAGSCMAVCGVEIAAGRAAPAVLALLAAVAVLSGLTLTGAALLLHLLGVPMSIALVAGWAAVIAVVAIGAVGRRRDREAR